MKYTEALGEALKSRRIKHEGLWGGEYLCLANTGRFSGEGFSGIFPSLDLMQSEKWEVEPEKPELITIWGYCTIHGESILTRDEPSDKSEMNLVEWLRLTTQNLFPKDKPVEYVLIKKEEYEQKDRA